MRVTWIDIVKGIGIILVVLSHSLNFENSVLIKWLNSFFMPMFFIMTGYTIKTMNKRKLISELIYLLKIYFIWASVGMVFSFILDAIKGNTIDYVQEIFNLIICKEIYNYSLWFIFAIAISKFVYTIILNKTNNRFSTECILSLFISVIGLGLTQNINHEIAFKFDIALTMMIFIFLGRVMKRYDFTIKKNGLQINLLIVASISSIIFGIYLNQEVAVFKAQYGNFIYFIISALSGAYIIIIFSKTIEIYSHIGTKILSWIGKNTLIILCTHSLCLAILSIIEIYLFSIEINLVLNIINFYLTLILEILFIILINRKVIVIRRINKSLRELIF